ncbi:MAG: diaminopimelate epimerase [Tannerella sp.]|jgi:diaminopimelate epimerase|nr:diaminopimelate epimerase [Tannerella sp.]
MTQKIKFHKMHGAGNDYIYVNTMIYSIENPEEKSRIWSDRHKGIGSDGLVLIGKSEIADFSMRIFNADGSEAMMCGNASRCIGKYVYDQGLTSQNTITLETLSGIKTIHLNIDNERVQSVTVDMGIAVVDTDFLTVTAAGKSFVGIKASVGNPHFVIFTDNISLIDLPVVGPPIETNPLFPDHTNVEFAEVRDINNVRMRVWERGSGITMACGTGACATLAVCAALGKTSRQAAIEMDGGVLNIMLDDNNHLQMTGPAVTVFEGEIEA